jgi:hypothetical protein
MILGNGVLQVLLPDGVVEAAIAPVAAAAMAPLVASLDAIIEEKVEEALNGTLPSGGGALQELFFRTGAVSTGTGIIPFADTVPQITQGSEFLSFTVTPESASNRLVIEAEWNGTSTSTGERLTAALFLEGVADALDAVPTEIFTSGFMVSCKLKHIMVAGTESPLTFKVRVGTNGPGTTTMNGTGGNRRFGGKLSSGISIREIPPA